MMPTQVLHAKVMVQCVMQSAPAIATKGGMLH